MMFEKEKKNTNDHEQPKPNPAKDVSTPVLPVKNQRSQEPKNK